MGDASDAAAVQQADDMLRALLAELDAEERAGGTGAGAGGGEEEEEDAVGDGGGSAGVGYRVLTVLNKADLSPTGVADPAAAGHFSGDAARGSHVVSCKTGAGTR